MVQVRRALLAATVSIAVLSACSTTAGPTGASSTPTPSANAVTDAVIQSKGLATASIEIEATTSIDGVVRTQHGTGQADVSRGVGAITWTADDGSVVREISNGKGLFVQAGGSDSLWDHLPGATSTPTGRLADPLRGLGGLAGVSAQGADEVDGVPATRYHGTSPADPMALSLLGLPDATLTRLGDAWQGTDIDITVWVTDTGRVVRVDRAWDVPESAAGPVGARTSTRLSDYVSLINIDPPPAQSVAASD